MVRGWRRYLAGLLTVILVVTLADQPALAQSPAAPEWDPPEPPGLDGVEAVAIPPREAPGYAAASAVVAELPSVTWPEPATVEVAIPSNSIAWAGIAAEGTPPRPGTPGRVAVGELPVRVGAAPLTPLQASLARAGIGEPVRPPREVVVRVADRDATAAAGVRGLLLQVARGDGVRREGSVTVEIDYSGFRLAYGGNWASRLRVTSLGRCHAASCAGTTVLPTAQDHENEVLVATVPVASDGGFTTLAVSGGPAGDNGDYTATSLKPAATWQVSAQTGGFSWSYPLRVVPGTGGPEPSLALSYSSQAVDGLTVNTNSQGSWVGDGWDIWPGYIERSYRSCAADTDAQGGQDPNNETNPTGDRCWFSDNATLSLNGRAVELVKDGADTFRPVDDDGTRVERLHDTGLGNGDNDGEYWRVTTTDGTQYYFGRHRRPAYPSDTAATNSTWTVPVYGNHPGEPCHDSGDFSDSRCTQAWRWNLDYLVDPHGNSMSLFYTRETGAYGRENDPNLRTTYHRGGYLKRIEYGTRTGTEHSQPVAARLMFDVADRCLPNETCTSSNPSAWPDTPWDQYCLSAPCTDQLAPTFWTQKRLDTIRSQVWRGSSFDDVESWELRQEYLDAGATDGEGIPMWLRGITRTGHVTTAGGAVVSDPEITFDPGGMPMANRVDGPSDGRTSLFRWRVRTIHTESGAEIGIAYSNHDCTSSTLPDPHTNTKRCFPQWYAPAGFTPTLDWFHKYVVTRVDVHDLTGASPQQQTNYDYLDDPAWHYDDSELVDKDKRTWGQWRGYSEVRVRQGLDGQAETATEFRYLRGMDGDRASPSGGTKSVTVTDSQGVAITDHEAHAGFLREETVLDGPGGSWVSGTIYTPWRHGPTASSGPLESWLTGTQTTRSRTALSGGGTRWTKTTTSFDTTYGMPTQVDDLGDESTSADDRCVRYEYARNTSLWIVDKVSRLETVGVKCATSPDRPDDVLSDLRLFYDDPDTFGAAPTRGLEVKTQEVGDWSGATPQWVTTSRTTYDANGRPLEISDALDRTTTVSYTPAVAGPVTSTSVTNAAGHTTTSVLEPAWGSARQLTDANSRVTEMTYDGLGRLTEVWLPGRNPATQSPNLTFEYLLRDDAPSAVTTRTLLPDGSNYRTSITLLDGQLRERQTQIQAPGGGRSIVDTGYDERGLLERVTRPYYDTTNAPPDTTLVGPGQPQVPGVIEYLYDGAGRVTDEVFLRLGSEAWRTSYAYGGDRVHTTPPEGGTATTTISDARGQVVALRQYHGPAPTGGYDETTYTYTERGELATVTDPAGNTWSYTYDQRGRKTEAVDPDAGVTTTTYDDASQVLTTTDGRGVTLGYTYDDLGRRTSVRDGSPTGTLRAEWVYDTLPGGVGMLTRSIRHHDGEEYVSEVVGYDSGGRPTGTRTIIPAAETGLAGTYQSTMSYRPDGSLATATLPAAGGLPFEFMIYAYNDVGMPTWLTSSMTSYVADVSYNGIGELVQLVLGPAGKRSTVTYQIDEPTGRLLNTSAVSQSQPEIMDLAYAYDDAGNLVRVADSPGSATPNDTQCFAYDYLRRLVEAWTPAATGSDNCEAAPGTASLGGQAPYWHSYTYDLAGNRLTETAHATGGNTVSTYTYPAAGGPQPHTLTEVATTGPGGNSVDSFSYDDAGNTVEREVGGVLQLLTWDAEGRVESITEPAGTSEYLYDADGGRLIRYDPDGTKTLYLPGQELTYDPATASATCTRYYSHLGTQVAVRTPTELTWVVTDHHNTATAMVRDSDLAAERERTAPFGEQRGAAPAWWAGDKGFLGGTVDPAGLVHLGARLYDPDIGRFISVDPIMDLADPQQMHGYAYANSNPTTWSDPTGLYLCADSDCNDRRLPDGEAMSHERRIGELPLPHEPGHQKFETLNDFALFWYEKPYHELTMEQKETAWHYAWSWNNPAAYDRWMDEGNDELGQFFLDVLGIQDHIDCFGDGAASACAWVTLDWATFKSGRVFKSAIEILWKGFRRFMKGGDAVTDVKPWHAVCSFDGDTGVLMADGTVKPISQIETGDQVLATDPETGQQSAETVLAVWVHSDTVVELEFEDGSSVTTTEDHPFWNQSDQHWQPAETLQPGDQLLTTDTTTIPTIAGIDWTTTHTTLTYNLTITTTHTYNVLAGDAPVLVHNVCWSAPGITVNRHGQLTNGRYTLDSAGMEPHVNGTPGKSQFGFHVNSGKAVLDAAAYADEFGLWKNNKAKVPVANGIVGYTGRGQPTTWINVYRTDSGFVHGSPGNAP